MDQTLGGEQAQDGVAEELEALIVLDLGRLLAREGTVCEGESKQGAVTERIAEGLFDPVRTHGEISWKPRSVS